MTDLVLLRLKVEVPRSDSSGYHVSFVPINQMAQFQCTMDYKVVERTGRCLVGVMVSKSNEDYLIGTRHSRFGLKPDLYGSEFIVTEQKFFFIYHAGTCNELA